jgi:hypothetical protein
MNMKNKRFKLLFISLKSLSAGISSYYYSVIILFHGLRAVRACCPSNSFWFFGLCLILMHACTSSGGREGEGEEEDDDDDGYVCIMKMVQVRSFS